MAYSTTTERAAASEQLIINAILPGLRGVKDNRTRGVGVSSARWNTAG